MIRISMPRIPSLVLLALLSSGCLNDSRIVAPDSTFLAQQSTAQGRLDPVRVPLVVGNRWVWLSHQLSQASVNGGPMEVYQDVTWRTTHELFCEQNDRGDHLVLVAEATQLPNGGGFGTWRLRENRHGLWRSISPQPLPAECEPPFLTTEIHPLSATSVPGLEAFRQNPRQSNGEKRLLAYPLRIGSRWLMDDAGPTWCTVEAYERVELPTGSEFAYRIRLEGPYQSPTSRSLVWYGKSGFLKAYGFAEEVTTLADGSIRRYTSSYTEVLQSIHLVEAGSSSAIRALSSESR